MAEATKPMESPMSVQRAERELAALTQQIDMLKARIDGMRDRAVKLSHYIEVAGEFDYNAVSSEEPARHAADPKAPQGGMSGRAVKECKAILRERGRPVKTKELFDLIQQRGIRLGGANPCQALSGYLSRSEGLISDRTVGWSLEEWNTQKRFDDLVAINGGAPAEPPT
jgi:hypothetical protein